MFWRTEFNRRAFVDSYLVINRVEVLTSKCGACGEGFAPNPVGERVLIAAVSGTERPLFFCASCGDNIMGRIQSDEPKKHYLWDWAVPLKDPGQG
jgi:hypothetical protein